MLSHWKTKSDENLDATNNLIGSGLYSSSVHCAYYSCVQMMYHILSSHFMWNDNKINQDSTAGGRENNQGLHVWLINTIFKELSAGNSFDANNFQKAIIGLKKTRTKADYKNMIIMDNVASNVQLEAIEALRLLKKNFKI